MYGGALSALGWKLRRLQAMSAAEIVHRSRAVLRERLLPPAWSRWAPATAADRLFPAGAPLLPAARWDAVRHLPPASALAGTRDAAARLARGRWTLFGREVELADPPRWNVAPAGGATWPDRPSRSIDYRRTDLAGGAKAVWEAGRLTMLPTLAVAERTDPGAGHAARARRWLADFVARQPLGHGIHHTSGIEMAIRVITTTWTLALLEADPRDGGRGREDSGRIAHDAAGLVAQQAMWCRDHLSLGSSANNHLLAEYAAMVVAGAGLPGLRGADRLLAQGLEGLERQIPLQILDDGVTAEQAFRYLPFVWELLLPALRLAESAGRGVAPATRARLAASVDFARALRRADGTLPPVGDEDDARVLLADESATRLDLAGNALAAWLGQPGLAAEAQGLAILLTGRPAASPRAAPDGLRRFETGGCTVWRAGGAFATFDHGPLGLGPLAAHGHADALSVTLRHGADDLIVDPGTLAYHEDEAARAWTRGTPAHSTVHFGGRSQSEMLGPFLWGRRARIERSDDGDLCAWWTGERHARRVEFRNDGVAIHDRVDGAGPELGFALAPGAQVSLDGTRATVTIGASRMTLESEGAEGWRVEAVEAAPRFGDRRPAPRLAASLRGSRAVTRVGFGPR